MKAISLFSGAGGMDLGLERAGITTVLQAEIDPHCRKVLERHWPEVEKIDDVRDLSNAALKPQEQLMPDHGSIDAHLVHGGFPCQDLSTAGKRAGLSGERSGLWFEFARIIGELQPRWCLIENVPGLLSSHKGRDFAVLLSQMDELGYDAAWGTLDAKDFGVPQRRRRVFIVGGLRSAGCGGPAPAAVLALGEGGDGHPAKGGEAGQEATGAIAIRTAQTGSNGWGVNLEGLAYSLDGSSGQAVLPARDLAPALSASGRGTARVGESRGQDPLVMDTYIPETVGTLSDGAHNGGGLNGQDVYSGRIFAPSGRVRRLTPRECERLMSWPDDHTRFDADGKEIADSHRYKMCGNGVVSNVAEWIGHRLVAVDELLHARN